MSRGGPPVPAGGHGPHHAAHVDELPAAHLFVDDHSGEQRPFEPAAPEAGHHRPVQPPDGQQSGIFYHDRHPGRCGAGYRCAGQGFV